MRVDEYFFSWQHLDTGTVCRVYKNPPKGLLKDIPATAIGISKLHPNDHYDAAVGRKISLLKVLQQLTKMGLIDDYFRPRVWETYRMMTKIPRWPVKLRVG